MAEEAKETFTGDATITLDITPLGWHCLTLLGSFGGGTLTPTVHNSTQTAGNNAPLSTPEASAISFTDSGYLIFQAPNCDKLDLVLSGSTTPDIDVWLNGCPLKA
mgnify:FL=1